MNVIIKLNPAMGINLDNFSIFSDSDNYTTPIVTGIARSILTSTEGYLLSNVPDDATIIRVKSTGDCTNYVDLLIEIDEPTYGGFLTDGQASSTNYANEADVDCGAAVPTAIKVLYNSKIGLLQPGDVISLENGGTFNGLSRWWVIAHARVLRQKIRIDSNGVVLQAGAFCVLE